MPSSPIAKEITLPDNWVQLQKTMIPDQTTACYWSVWFDVKDKKKGTAWLMWCAFGDDPSVNDSWAHAEDIEVCEDTLRNWAHAEDIDESCRNVLDVIESVYGVSFHESMWIPMTAEQMLKDNPII